MKRVVFFWVPLLAACLAPPSAGQRLNDAAYELNVASRFGRGDIALERVAAETKRSFSASRAGWGRDILVVDAEIVAVRGIDDDDAQVDVTYTWQRKGESLMRTTQVVQDWRDEDRAWLLMKETRATGDVGLLGEPPPAVGSATAPAAPKQFPTRVLGGSPTN